MLYSKIVPLAALMSNVNTAGILAATPASRIATSNNLTLLNDSFDPKCDSFPYGFNLEKRSCEEAVDRLPHNVGWIDESLPYVNRDNERGVVGPRYVLPWRELSCMSHNIHHFPRSSLP